MHAGVYRAAPFRVNPRQAALHALFKTYIDVVHVQRDESRRIFSVANAKAAAAAAKDKEGEEPTILSAPNTPGYSNLDTAGGSQNIDMVSEGHG